MHIEKYCPKCGNEIAYKGWIGTIYEGKKFCNCKNSSPYRPLDPKQGPMP